MTFNSSRRENSIANKYLYNGKELQEETGWLDYGARFFDPSLGRFNTLDPLAELMSSWNPYHYTYNNPINFTDPTGMIPAGKPEEERQRSRILPDFNPCICESSGGGGNGGKENEGPSGQIDNSHLERTPNVDPLQPQGVDIAHTITLPTPTAVPGLGVSGGVAALGVGAAYVGWQMGPLVAKNFDAMVETVAKGLVWIGVPSQYLYGPGSGNENYPGPWSYTLPDPTIPLPRPFHKSPVGNRFPNNNPSASNWAKAFIYGAGLLDLSNRLKIEVPNLSGLNRNVNRFYKDVIYKTRKGIADYKNDLMRRSTVR